MSRLFLVSRSLYSIISQINCRDNAMRYNISGWKCGKRIRKRLAMNNIKELLNYLKLNYILHGGLCVCTRIAVSENPSPPYFMSASCRPIISGKNWGVITIKTASGDAQDRRAWTVVYTDIANETSAAFSSDKCPCLASKWHQFIKNFGDWR